MDSNRVSLKIFKSKQKIKKLKKEQSQNKEKLKSKKKEIEDMQLEIALILYEQDKKNIILENLNLRMRSLDESNMDYKDQKEELISEKGFIFIFESVIMFINDQMIHKQEKKNLKKKEICYTNDTLKKYVNDIRECYHYMNQKINFLVGKYKKKDGIIKLKKAKAIEIEKQIEKKSNMLLKITEPKSTFEEVIKSFIEKNGDSQINNTLVIKDIEASKYQLEKGIITKDFDNNYQEYLILQKSINLNNNLLNKVKQDNQNLIKSSTTDPKS